MPQPAELMNSAWTARRDSFDAPPERRAELEQQARRQLRKAVAICRESGAKPDLAQALHLLANVEVDRGETDAARVLRRAAGRLRLIRNTNGAQAGHA